MSRQATQSTQEASARPRRTPIGQRNRLSIRNKEDGYFYRIVNSNLESDPERVQALLDQGYELVPADKAGKVGDSRVDNPSTLGSSSLISVGQGTKAVVLRIRRDWYDEDQRAKQAEIEAQEATMKRASDYGDIKIDK